jgi:hypothetical protein
VLLLVVCGPFSRLEIVTAALKDGKVGQPYADTVRTDGGYEGVEVTVLSGQLPPGIAFREVDDDAELYGTPVLAGQYLFTVQARDRCEDPDHGRGSTVSRGFVVNIQP